VVEKGLWPNTYSATNYWEYLAQGVGMFFNAAFDDVYNDISTREELQAYDADLYGMIDQLFPSEFTNFSCPTDTECDCSTFECPGSDVPFCAESATSLVSSVVTKLRHFATAWNRVGNDG